MMLTFLVNVVADVLEFTAKLIRQTRADFAAANRRRKR